MCGIVAKFQFNGNVIAEELLHKMCNTIIYRGPDSEGIYSAPYIGLGQRRLSIIDLRPEGTAPLSNEDGSVWVTFNGEIYNFEELRAELEAFGHIFRTRTDTEVLVHIYEQWGTDCLRRLRGMFAFVIWDSRKKQIFAARDRLGKKPLCFARTSSSLVIGSEIKAITADPEISISPNFSAIDRYLTLQYVPSPQSAFCGIEKLPAAHFFTCDYKGNFRMERYWSPPPPSAVQISEQDACAEIMAGLRESVRLRMISDVPLGAFLSGGVDSGTIVALMAEQSAGPVKTFSIGFEEEEFNELSFARKVAERYATDHHEFIVQPDLVDVLPRLVRHYNEPFADSSAVPTYYVSKLARESVTVALTGDGGDETFAGYSHYFQTARWEGFDVVPHAIRQAGTLPLERLLGLFPYRNDLARTSRGLHMIASRLPERYATQVSILKVQEKNALFTAHFRALAAEQNLDYAGSSDWFPGMNSFDWMMRYDQSHYLPDCLMVKTDIAAMANSLELRCPFLDHKVVEMAARIPIAMKINGNSGKVILKKAVASLLPADLLRKPKTGFGVPLTGWFRKELYELLRANLLDEKCIKRNLFKTSFVNRMIEEHRHGQRDWSSRLWALLFLELWFREFIDLA